MKTEEFEALIKKNSEKSKELLSDMKMSGGDYSIIVPLIHRYVYLRFMLEEKEYGTDSLEKLAEISIENIAGWKKQGVVINENSGGCSAISSALTKKVLLLISLQKGLDIRFGKNETADITTVTELAKHVSCHLQK